MEDERIIGLYFARDEKAVEATEEKYGRLLKKISLNILGSSEDAAECLNDTLLRLWQKIPPERPDDLKIYACRIIRNASLDMLKRRLAKKRSPDVEVPLDELEGSLADISSGREFDRSEFSMILDRFLRELRPESRVVFLKRYFFFDSEPQIAADLGISESKVKSLLHRARIRFRKYLHSTEEDL